MEQDGWIAAEDVRLNNRRTRSYRLTAVGRELAEEEKNWSDLTRAVAAVPAVGIRKFQYVFVHATRGLWRRTLDLNKKYIRISRCAVTTTFAPE